MDIRAFFPSIDRHLLLDLWHRALPKLPYNSHTLQMLDQVATALITQSPVNPPPHLSGDIDSLTRIPPHKSLFHTKPGVGLPIGSLTSQFFANVYLNELDHYIKHTLKIKGYLRYVDDFIILGSNPESLTSHQNNISTFLNDHLRLQLHPHKTILQRCTQGANFLGNIVFPSHKLVRQRSVRALKRRLNFFQSLLSSKNDHLSKQCNNAIGSWERLLKNNNAFTTSGIPSIALLQRMLATINSYYGQFQHTQSYTLRKHIYHQELKCLTPYFLPSGPDYKHLRIRKQWLLTRW